jgi:hypothetical protein
MDEISLLTNWLINRLFIKMINSTTTINFKGITLPLQFGAWAVEKYADEMSKLVTACPDIDIHSFGEISATTIIMCGYWNHCFETNFPRIYNWLDFYEHTKSRLVTRIASEELKTIFNLFMQKQEEYLKMNNNG